MAKSRNQDKERGGRPQAAGELVEGLERLASRLRARRVSQADYDKQIDQLLGTGLPDRDLEAEQTYEQRRQRQQ